MSLKSESKEAIKGNSDLPLTSPISSKEVSHSKRSPIKYVSLSLLALILINFAIAKLYYCFLIFDEKFYKSNFYSWRIKFADPLMYKSTWMYITNNKYYSNDPTNKYTQFIDRMQTKQLLFTGHPEHYPRQHKHYDSHSDHSFNDDFLEFRKSLCDAYDEPLNENIVEGKELLTEKKMLYWTGKKANYVKKAYLKASSDIRKFMRAFTTFLNKLHSGSYKKSGLVGKECSEEIVDDLERMSVAAGLDLDRSYLAEMPQKFGLIKPKTIENFCYSRMFYLFYLCTLDCDIDLESKSEDKKIKPSQRIETVACCFTQLLSEIYEYDHGEGRKQLNGVSSFLMKGFGVPEVNLKDQSSNIDILMEELNDVVGPTKKRK